MQRSKRRRKEEKAGAGHERWLVSYADFITLLFAFFTTMYAVSSVNEAKYRSISGSITTAFRNRGGSLSRAGDTAGQGAGRAVTPVSVRFQERFSERFRKVSEAVKGLDSGLGIRLFMERDRIVIRMPGDVLFGEGDAGLTPGARKALITLAPTLMDLGSEIRIEGHTDNVPINRKAFGSNWDLSSARALAVLKFFMKEFAFDPHLVSATAYGEYRPIASNATPEGRRKNRRVDIVVER